VLARFAPVISDVIRLNEHVTKNERLTATRCCLAQHHAALERSQGRAISLSFYAGRRICHAAKLVIMRGQESNCPHFASWGDSVYIYSANEFSGTYRIEMQSGDELTFKGKGHEFSEAAL